MITLPYDLIIHDHIIHDLIKQRPLTKNTFEDIPYHFVVVIELQRKPLNVITLGPSETDNINQL